MKELIARQCRLKVVRKDFHDFVCAQHICDVYTNLLLCKQSSNRKCRDGFCHNPRHTLREREKVHFFKNIAGGLSISAALCDKISALYISKNN